jgi:hypothetical protein
MKTCALMLCTSTRREYDSRNMKRMQLSSLHRVMLPATLTTQMMISNTHRTPRSLCCKRAVQLRVCFGATNIASSSVGDSDGAWWLDDAGAVFSNTSCRSICASYWESSAMLAPIIRIKCWRDIIIIIMIPWSMPTFGAAVAAWITSATVPSLV